MVRFIWGKIAVLSLFFLVLPGGSEGVCAQQTLDYIYINSSVDQAAGGHAALRFGQTVFHYQYYADGYFVLVKDEWDEFRYLYNDLQNRTLAIAALPVPFATYQKIKTQFLSRYLLQRKRFAYFEQLKAEEKFFQALLAGEGAVSIKRLGLFSSDQRDDPFAFSLKEFIGQKLGISYLEDLSRRIDARLKNSLENHQPSLLENRGLSPYLPSLSFSSTLYDYFELCAFREAVSVLLGSRPVLRKMLYMASSDIGKLSEIELDKLKQYGERIRLSIISLLESTRPDIGNALLLQAARLQAIGHSIKKREMVTLDPFSENAELVQIDDLMSAYVSMQIEPIDRAGGMVPVRNMALISKRTYFEQLRHDRLRDFRKAKDYFFSTQANEEISFHQLETSLGRLWELDQAGKKQGVIRIEGRGMLPGKPRLVTIKYSIGQEDLLRFSEILRANKASFQKQLMDVYDYNLFGKNCVTELFETVYSSFTTIDQAEKKLGGYLDPGKYFSFVPFHSFSMAQKSFPAVSIEILPSFRKRQMDVIYQREGALALLKESNTLTSTLYYSWDNDSAFLLFTDDTLLLRPIMGVINFLYAAVSSLGGLFSVPVDEGVLLRRSLKGMVFSLPELAFINIRKGTFPAIATDKE